MARDSRVLAVVSLLAGTALFLLVNGAVFGSGLYGRWIDPQSRDAAVARSFDISATSLPWSRRILVIGDSRIGEGFSAQLANEAPETGPARVAFINGAVPSSNPRSQFYLIREHLRRGHRPAVIALMTHTYRDGHETDLDKVRYDLGLLHTLVGLEDIATYPASYTSWSDSLEAVKSILLNGLFFRADLMAFLRAPRERLKQVVAWRENGRLWIDVYPGRDDSLQGLSLDPVSGAVHMPAQVASPIREAIADYARGLRVQGDEDDPAVWAFRSHWFRKIAEITRQAGVRLVVFRMPRGPLHANGPADEEVGRALGVLLDGDWVRLVPADAFSELEQPEFFFDQLHLNRAGRERFSPLFAKRMLRYVADED